MADIILVRSPRIVSETGVVNDDIKCEIYLWNEPSSIPANPTYTLNKPIPSTIQTTVYFDVSPFCKRYINHLSYTEVVTDTEAFDEDYCYCTVMVYKNDVLQDTYEYIAFDGYGYFEDGYNPDFNEQFLTEGTYYVETGVNSGGLYYYDDGGSSWQARWTGLSTGNVYTQNLAYTIGYVPYINVNTAGEGNTLEILKGGIVQYTYTFEELEECKYDTYKCDFINKFGVWQRLVFFKASRTNISMSNKEYNQLPTTPNYNVKSNIRTAFNINAQETITCNTGWVNEGYDEVIKQLLMSEKILLNDKPVLIDTKSVELQKNINNKNINYQMAFKYSNPVLNYNI